MATSFKGLVPCVITILFMWSCTCTCWHYTLAAAQLLHKADMDHLALQLLYVQQRILSTFKQHVRSDPMGALASWQASRDMCSWTGVVCGAPHGSGQVVALKLTGLRLKGTITPLLFNLPFLTHLNLSDNFFEGSFPDVAQAGNGSTRASLVSLDLSSNRLSGTLPASIDTLSRLQVLWLRSNNFWGPIPLALGRCNQLVELGLGAAPDGVSRGRLNNTIPHTLANLSSLVVLRLSYSNLVGPIPVWLGSSLPMLEILDLSFNQLNGAIPSSLGNLTSLSSLNFIDNQELVGEVPVQLGSCNKLISLRLGMSNPPLEGRNKIGGTLGMLFAQVLRNMTSLEHLIIKGTQIMGTIPHDFAMLRSLVRLDLRANFLQEEIPHTMGNLTNLEYVYLAFNDFRGSIPKEFGLCNQLKVFIMGGSSELRHIITTNAHTVTVLETYMYNKDLVGQIPAEMGHLPLLTDFVVILTNISGTIPDFSNATALARLNLSQNKLEGVITTQHMPASLELLGLAFNRLTGPIPPSISNLSNLLVVAIRHNDIEGKIPSEFALCSKLQRLQLGGSSMFESRNVTGKSMISGSIPKELGQLVHLTELAVSSTQVTGTIPWLGNCTLMITLMLNDNELSGGLPAWLSNLTSLDVLDVTTNRLSGSLSVVEWSKLQLLKYLFLSRNKITGNIPNSLGKATKLQFFLASEMRLVGSLPLSLKNSSNLAVVDLQSNGLNGNISDALDILADTTDGQRVHVLMLSSNMFYGSMPTWIGSRFRNLQMLLLAGNLIHGSIPYTLSHLPTLQKAQPDDPNEYVLRHINSVTDPLFKLTLKNVTTGYFSITFGLTILDLSDNYLSGELPAELSHLVGLRYLNVSHNHLSGSIPPTFSNLTSLVQLDVSNNNLSGSIPGSLASLCLDFVDFSSNKLVGHIPFGTSYGIASYLDNPGLCGELLHVSCSAPPQSPIDTEQRHKPSSCSLGIDTPISWVGFWLGFCISFLVTLGLFLLTSKGLDFIFGDTEPSMYIVEHGLYRQPGLAL